MDYKLNLLVVAATCFVFVARVQGQEQMPLFQFCDLSQTEVYFDPLIVPEEALSSQQRVFPSATARNAIRKNPTIKAVLDGAQRAASLSAAAARSSGRGGNRTRRNVGPEFIASSKYNNMCGAREVLLKYSLHYDESTALPGQEAQPQLCYIMPHQDIRYMTCGDSQCNMPNPFPNYFQYRCEPDTYTYVSAVSVCEDEQMRDQVFYVPVNCCCRLYRCNLKQLYQTPRRL